MLSRYLPSELRVPFSALYGWGVFTVSRALTVFGLSVASVAFEAAGVAMIYPILNYVEADRNMEALTADSRLWQGIAAVSDAIHVPVTLATLSLVVLVAVLARQVANYMLAVAIDEQKFRSGAELGRRCFGALLNSQAQHLQGIDTGRFVHLIDYEVQASVTMWRSYATMIRLVLSFLMYGLVMLVTAPLASLLAAVMIGLVLASINGYIALARRRTRTVLARRRALTQFVAERWQAWKVLRLSDRLPEELERFDRRADEFRDAAVDLTRITQKMQLVMAPLMTALALGLVYVSLEWLTIPLSVLTLFVVVFVRLIPIAQGFAGHRQSIANFAVSVENVARELREARQFKEPDSGSKRFETVGEGVRFESMSFCYDNGEGPALDGVSVLLPVESITAITGPSGAGKSTLVDLIPRLIEPQSGRILIGGTPLKEFSLSSLRRGISYSPQHAFVFNASVRENVRYARPSATDEEVEHACRRAHAHDFIAWLPEGYETVLGEGGNRLSGGQRQRLALARVFLARPLILILDEPTSALDHESERHVHDALRALVDEERITVIIVAHHLATVMSADQLVVLESGRVTAVGDPRQLTEENPWLTAMLHSGWD